MSRVLCGLSFDRSYDYFIPIDNIAGVGNGTANEARGINPTSTPTIIAAGSGYNEMERALGENLLSSSTIVVSGTATTVNGVKVRPIFSDPDSTTKLSTITGLTLLTKGGIINASATGLITLTFKTPAEGTSKTAAQASWASATFTPKKIKVLNAQTIGTISGTTNNTTRHIGLNFYDTSTDKIFQGLLGGDFKSPGQYSPNHSVSIIQEDF